MATIQAEQVLPTSLYIQALHVGTLNFLMTLNVECRSTYIAGKPNS